VTRRPLLLDETSRPTVREVIGSLMASSATADLAVARIRLAALDLTEHELGVRRCRLLLGRLDAAALADAPVGAPAGANLRASLGRLLRFAASGRLEVRSAGIGAWQPDFSVFGGPGAATCLVGAHYFVSPDLIVGPSLTCVTTDPDAVALVRRRFAWLWDRSHDVLPAIVEVLQRVEHEAGAGGGDPDPA
jgi:hypothetical protein